MVALQVVPSYFWRPPGRYLLQVAHRRTLGSQLRRPHACVAQPAYATPSLWSSMRLVSRLLSNAAKLLLDVIHERHLKRRTMVFFGSVSPRACTCRHRAPPGALHGATLRSDRDRRIFPNGCSALTRSSRHQRKPSTSCAVGERLTRRQPSRNSEMETNPSDDRTVLGSVAAIAQV
jgi:hypothetical protein